MRGQVLLACLTLVFLAGASPAPGASAKRGDVVFETKFEGDGALAGWEPASAARLVAGYQGSTSLMVELPEDASPRARMVRRALPMGPMRGSNVYFEAMVKAHQVTKPPRPWNGVKFMLHYQAPSRPGWTQRNGVHGTFDWKPVRFAARVPRDATQAWVYLGLEQAWGRVWFDAVRITIGQPPIVGPNARADGPVFKGHGLPRLRGAMIPQRIDEEGLRVFGKEWNANVVRWQLTRYFVPGVRLNPRDPASYDRWLVAALAQMDRMLPACEKYGLMVVIDLHCPPGGAAEGAHRMFREQLYQDKFVETWQRIASRYRGRRVIWGYDLANEPIEGVVAEGLLDWHGLAERAAQAIRAIDPETAIIVEPAYGGGPGGFKHFWPIHASGVLYSVHVYVPHVFTHQGIKGRPAGFIYPGKIGKTHWDKERLREALEPVVEFQRRYRVHVYVGEFSAVRWAPDHSAYRYIRDAIELFEQYGWDWTYHAFRESNVWSVEHGTDPDDREPTQARTERERLLRDWFGKNVKP